ncbi:hypothetical protein EJC47_10980 [Sphingomonas sp. TF3]|uniref:hypothetical protein n=1 Tax=Sphingomonas sp. TF3 TaxID=2495580 RepID=UPI000F88CD29|nr:hypothetical protein [Sphingomonas sp. TF3]RUN76488.1 hypothetical protein EJC47_10980 [Sphingomonas sp. TF3]
MEASLNGTEGVQLAAPRWLSRPLRLPGLPLGTVVLDAGRTDPHVLRPLFDAAWLGSGFEDGTPSFAGQAWKGDTTPALYEPLVVRGSIW